MDAGVEVKVEPYDGTYVCLMCGDSVRGMAALTCSVCSSNPWHRPGTACNPHPKYAEVCPTCGRQTVEAWRGGASAGTGAPGVRMDLTGPEAWEGGGEGGAMLTGNGARGDAAPAVGGAMVAEAVGQGVRGGSADAGDGRSDKGKEIANNEGAVDDGGEGAGTSAGAGAVGGGGGKGKERADDGSVQARRGSHSGEGSGGEGRWGHCPGGAGGSRKRAAPDGDEGGSSGWKKRALAGKPGKCEHNRRRSQCRECGGSSICQHNRRRSECKECGGGSICEHLRIRSQCRDCGGGSICQHNRIRSRCKTCQADKDESMPPDLEEL